MRKNFQAILSGFLAVFIMFYSAFPAYAASSEYISKDTFWNWASENTSGLLSAIISYAFEDVCTVSDDGRHHASYNLGHVTNIMGQESLYYRCICDYCGQSFDAYERDVQQSYSDYVDTLPATGYNSDGHLIMRLSFEPKVSVYRKGASASNGYKIPYNNVGSAGETSIEFSESGDGIIYSSILYRSSSDLSVPFCLYASCPIPLSGYYRMINSVYCYYKYMDVGGISYEYTTYYPDSGYLYYRDDSSWSEMRKNYMYPSGFVSVSYTSFYAHLYGPIFEVIPDMAPSGDIYNITTRPTSITGGNYGIIGDNGQITQIEDNRTIINEGDSIYYNPVTGETGTITDWSYDYGDRSYTITLETGDTATVTYGDENITIVETTIDDSSDTITNNYTLYYIVEGSGAGSGGGSGPGGDTHTHDWRETDYIVPTCIQPGKKVYTCATCYATKQESIPSLGHDWRVLRAVTNEYDEDGTLIVEGYVLYQCDRCHEQYKTTDTSTRPSPGGGTTNPDISGDDDSGGNWFTDLLNKIGEIIGAIFGALLELLGGLLTGLLDSLIDMVTNVIKSLASLVDLFGSFGDALGVLWTWLPPEIMAVLIAGVSIFVLFALLRIFIK